MPAWKPKYQTAPKLVLPTPDLGLAPAAAWRPQHQPSNKVAVPMAPVAMSDLVKRVNSARAEQPGPAGRSVGGGMVIHFSPQITVRGGDPAAMRAHVTQAVQLSFVEFERMMKRYEHEKGRTAYGRNA